LHPKVAATSISGDNLSDGLWTELSKWQQRSPFLHRARSNGRPRASSRAITPRPGGRRPHVVALGERGAAGNTLAGLHADYILFVIDEAGGIPTSVLVAAEAALASGIECRILMAGNPIETDGALGRACNCVTGTCGR
jgi:phage terminase large subunit